MAGPVNVSSSFSFAPTYVTAEDRNEYAQASNSNVAAQSAGSANQITAGAGSRIELVQESPQALATLEHSTIEALRAAAAQTQAGFALAGTLGTNALEEAKAALTPVDERLYSLVRWVVVAAAVGFLVFFFLRRRS
jgi:hypothetical protein